MEAVGASTQPREARTDLVLKFLLKYGMVLAIVALIAFFSWQTEYFLTVDNLLDILRSVSILVIVTIGLTVSVVVNGFDVFVGAVTGLAVILTPALRVIWQLDWYLAVPIALLIGVLVGLVNAWLIVKVRILDVIFRKIVEKTVFPE